MERLLEQCPSLFKPYQPTLLWGWNGHLQTAVLGKMGRSVNPLLPQVLSKLCILFTLSHSTHISYNAHSMYSTYNTHSTYSTYNTHSMYIVQ